MSGKAKSKLDGFLTYFQRYLFMRGYVPPSTEYEVTLEPNPPPHTSTVGPTNG